MKILSSGVLILTLCLTCIAQKMTDHEHAGFKGKVKLVEQWDEEFKVGQKSASATPKIVRDTSFDEAGNKIGSTFYPLGRKTTFFVLNGDKVSKSEHFEVPGVSVVRAASPNPSKPSDERYETKYVYDYDTKGRIAEIRVYLSDGTLDGFTTFTYDLSGRLRSETSTIRGTPHYKETFTYNPNGNISSSTFVSYDRYGVKSGAQFSTYTHYKLDDMGNWVERRETRSDPDDKNVKPKVYVEHRSITYF